MDDNTFFPNLSQNLLEILEDNEFYDTTIEVGNDPYVKIFHAHMIILYYRSPYLRRILSTDKKKDDDILTHIKLPNISPEIFQMILRYVYGGRLSLKEYDTSDIIKILVAANELNLQELITYLQSFLIKNKKIWMEQNFNLIYQTSFENNSFLNLQNFCKEIMIKEPEKVFNSINFNSISEKCLVSLIQHENSQMNVIQVWEKVLKWGIAQNPELPSDPSNYSKDDFNTLKNTLQKFIPFINFSKLKPKEFLNKHAELISKWIDELKINDSIKNLYEFKLILRGSRDGFSTSKFHEICDNQSHTITIIKVKGSDEILGGYNPIIWESGPYWGATGDSFIFSFKNKDNIENFILSRVNNDILATINSPNYGPSFGDGDLILNGNNFDKSYCSQLFYEKPIRETEDRFTVEEYEIFQIMK
ncbi:hypothetical protein RclHR1_21300003 [Rhizophagus clarus]|uniref:BTB domain-containing protein n=1 Tax=Rhizophagus clarus TaxID=94130 RepID=A0A2Z6QT96_9GLOM|nr:hypothetical protein RclHR1_21300003 [Rhizophagus clarus]